MTFLVTLMLLLGGSPEPAPADGWTAVVAPPATEGAAAVIAMCESDNLALAKNEDSTASGPWQFLDGTWEWVTNSPAPARAYPRHVQRAAFDKLYADGAGASHWAPSAHCWGDKL